MPNTTNKIKKLSLFCGDFLVLYISLYLTLIIRYGFPLEHGLWQTHFTPFTLVFIAWIIIFYIVGLYDANLQQNTLSFYSLVGKSLIICAVAAMAFFYFMPEVGISPKRVLFINLLVFALIFYLWRKLYNSALRSSAVTNNLLLIGINDQSKEIIEKIIENPQFGYRLSVIINTEGKGLPKLPESVKIINDQNFNLQEIIKKQKIQTVVSVTDHRTDVGLAKQLYKSLSSGANFLDLPHFYEQLIGKIPVNLISETWFLENLNENNKTFYESVKRILDIVFSVCGLIVSIPILPILSIAIKTDSEGPIFFTQIRTGKNGKRFLAIKLRTMAKDAEKNGPEWAKVNDSRVTRLGKFLRKTRIDEIPQLLNVLRGEMSFIGPRPERPEFVKTLEQHIPFYPQRLIIKPGLTGWAQINFPYSASIEDSMEKMQYDLFYIKNRSFGLDLSIILKTINTVLRGGGR